MNTSYKSDEIDTMIREALAQEDGELLKRFDEPSLRDMVGDVFRSRMRWLAILSGIVTFVFFVLGVVCAIRFVQAPEVRDMLLWGAGALFSCLAVMTIKLMAWMDFHRVAVAREVKRLELRLVQLAAEVRGGGGA